MSQLPKGLVYVSDNSPGYSRKKWGNGFRYFDKKNKPIKSKKKLKRFDAMTIPPIWEEVWICPLENGHLQSTGRDLKNRKQYIYHELWSKYSNQVKFDFLLEFGEALPQIRKAVQKDLSAKKWNKRKVVALAVKLMDEGFLRIGNKQYQKSNQTFGLTTLRRKHLDLEGDKIKLKYKAKSGKTRKIKLKDKELKKLLAQCSELPGYEVFRYKTKNGYESIDLADVNEYLKKVSGKTISAKNFRTWGGTVLSMKLACQAQEICAENPRKKLEPTLIKLISKKLGNTKAVCRKYYVHPEILKFSLGNCPLPDELQSDEEGEHYLTPAEEKVLELLGK